MPGPLRNTRHEAFAKALFERPKTGMTLAQCYESAGYTTHGHASETMASRLSFAEHIQARVSELQGAVARKAVISIESICAELDEANAVAKEHGQAGAMVSASTLRAKLAGLLREKVEISSPPPFSQCKSTTELAEAMLREIYNLIPTQAQIEQALALMMSHAAEWDALVAGRPPITIDAVSQPTSERHSAYRRRLPRLRSG
jgi:hypothetical protein